MHELDCDASQMHDEDDDDVVVDDNATTASSAPLMRFFSVFSILKQCRLLDKTVRLTRDPDYRYGVIQTQR